MIELKLTEEEAMYLLSLVSNFAKACEKSFASRLNGKQKEVDEAKKAYVNYRSIECKILKEVELR